MALDPRSSRVWAQFDDSAGHDVYREIEIALVINCNSVAADSRIDHVVCPSTLPIRSQLKDSTHMTGAADGGCAIQIAGAVRDQASLGLAAIRKFKGVQHRSRVGECARLLGNGFRGARARIRKTGDQNHENQGE